MNTKSHIVNLINDAPDSFEEHIKNGLHINVRRDGDLAIFNYTYGCDFSNPIVQEARGIIIDTKRLEVVCWPFRKFGNHNEPYADEIDWSSARVLEKVDGSIIKLWYDRSREEWQFSTNGMIRAEEATLEGNPDLNFMKIIKSAENYVDIPFSELDKNATYIFELVSPLNQIIIKYEKTMLYHIGTRHNLSGEEFECDIGIAKPKSYPLSSLSDCLTAAKELNTDNEDILAEGFVVVDGKYNRVKVKSPDYIVNHKLKLSLDISKRECIEILIEKRGELETIYKLQPSLEPVLKYYDFKLSELKYEADRLATLASMLLEEYNGDRAAMAKIISKHRLSFAAFRAIDRKMKASDALLSMPTDNVAKLIEDYVQSDLSNLF